MPDEYKAKYNAKVYELLKERFSSEFSRINNLDQKANNTIGFVGIILSFVSAIIGSFLIKDVSRSSNFFALYCFLFLLGIVLLVLSILCALMASWVKDYEIFPEFNGKPEDFLEYVKYKKEEEIIDESVEVFSSIIEENKKRINEKADFIKQSHKSLIIAIFVNIIFIAVILLTKVDKN
ncbi:Uncharacterised protein [uncultured archaeon]|nr:Uncharacterised protein [uncultured archaeon]